MNCTWLHRLTPLMAFWLYRPSMTVSIILTLYMSKFCSARDIANTKKVL